MVETSSALSRADIIKKEQDLSYLSWDEHRCPSGLGGKRPKAREGCGANAVYYKRSRDASTASPGQETLAQLMCCRLMDALGIEHTPFTLVHARLADGAKPTWVVKSKSYRKAGERAISLPYYWELASLPQESALDMCVRLGWGKEIAECMLVDYLAAVRDRDETCFEVLLDSQGALRLASIQPRGYSLANAFVLGTWKRDALADLGTSNYLGSRSLEANLPFAIDQLGYVPMPKGLKSKMLANLEDVCADPEFLKASWHIVSTRWERYESLCRL